MSIVPTLAACDVMVMGDVGEDVVIDVSVVHASEEEVGSAVMVEVFL